MSKTSFFRYIVVVVLAFIYFFPINFRFFPGFLNSRVIMFAIGGTVLLFGKRGGYRNKYLPKLRNYKNYIIAIFFIALFTSIINGEYERQFLVYPVTFLITLISCYGLLVLINKITKVELGSNELIDVFTGVIVFECLLSLVSFYVPSFNNFYYSLVELQELEEIATTGVFESDNPNRFVGVGITFFGAGIAFSISLFLIFVRLLSINKSFGKFVYIAVLVFIFFVGSAISRTSYVGVVLGIGYLVLSQMSLKSIFSFKKLFFIIGFVVLIYVAVVVYKQFVESDIMLETVFRHAFEGFYRYFEEGRFYTTSSDKSIDNYTWPNDISTWIIGDARLKVSETEYYMHVDIGWCRLIFYFGIIGTIVFILSQYCLFSKMRITKLAQVFVFFLLCIFLLKGLTDLMTYVMPYVLVGGTGNYLSKNKRLKIS